MVYIKEKEADFSFFFLIKKAYGDAGVVLYSE